MSFHFNLIRRNINTGSKYVIKRVIDGINWYFYDFSKVDNSIVWTTKVSRAIIFSSDKEVEDFKSAYCKGRKCEIEKI